MALSTNQYIAYVSCSDCIILTRRHMFGGQLLCEQKCDECGKCDISYRPRLFAHHAF